MHVHTHVYKKRNVKIQVSRVYNVIQSAFDAGYSTVSAQGSARSSKTYTIVIWLIVRCLSFPGTTVAVVRGTRPALKGTVYRDFKDIMQRMGQWSDKCMNLTDFIYTFPNGSWIEFFPATDDQRLRGRKRMILYVNEANELSFDEWTQLKLRTTLFTLIDYNPSFDEDHWIVTKVNNSPRTKFFISTYKDNPFLEQSVIDSIEELKDTSPSLWQVYGLGQRAIIEGRIFKSFEIVDELPPQARRHRFLGLDFGYTNDPTAIVLVSIVGKTIYLDELCYRTQMGTEDIIKELKQQQVWMPKVWADSAEPREIDEIYNTGIDIHGVKKYPGSVKAGLQKMQQFKLVVTRRSVNLIKELKSYVYRRDKNGKWLNEPVDAFNHCFTADTLVTTSMGAKRIANITTDDLVLTSAGYKRVTKLWKNGKRKIQRYTLVFDDAQIVVRATPNHLVKTAAKWQKIACLHAGDVVFTQTKRNEQTAREIKAIFAEDAGEAQVFDLEVAQQHEYYANGLLVHNCIDAIRYVILEEVLGQNGEGLDAEGLLDIL